MDTSSSSIPLLSLTYFVGNSILTVEEILSDFFESTGFMCGVFSAEDSWTE